MVASWRYSLAAVAAAASNVISPLSKGNYKLLPRMWLASYFRMYKEMEFELFSATQRITMYNGVAMQW